MDPNSLHAFQDELEKIAGMTRLGRPPVTVANALRGKGKFFSGMKTVTSGVKLSAKSFGPKHILAAGAAGVGLGLVGERKLKKAINNYQVGKAVNQQAAQ